MSRQPWDTYYCAIARAVSLRGTCDRRQVGCVLVSPFNSIIATGYNGSFRGTPHCDEVGHLMVESGCIRTIHAEANAVAQAAREGRSVEGATAFVTTFPCISCFKLLVQAGVRRIVWLEGYRGMDVVLELAKTLPEGVVVVEKHIPVHEECK